MVISIHMAKNYTGVAKEILYWIAVSGMVVIAMTSPYFGVSLVKQFGKIQRNKSGEEKAREAFYRLRKSKVIILSEKGDGEFVVSLTKQGKRKVQEMRWGDLFPARLPEWDGIWRIAIFDIPNKKKVGREAFRNKLKEWNFYQIQESVWAYPYPCEKEIGLLGEVLGLSSCINFIEAKHIMDDVKVRSYFKLL